MMKYYKDKDLNLFGREALSQEEKKLVDSNEWFEITLKEVDEINKQKAIETVSNMSEDEKVDALYSELSYLKSRLELAELVSDEVEIARIKERMAEIGTEIKRIRK